MNYSPDVTVQKNEKISVSASGFEPETNSLKGCCSTVELRARIRVLSERIELSFKP